MSAAVDYVPSECTIKSYAPAKIVIGTAPVTKTFSVSVKDCTLSMWSVVLWPFYDDAPLSTKGVAGNYWYWDKSASGTDVKVHLKAKMTLSPKQLSNSYAGRWPDGGFVKAIGEEDLAKEDEDENVVATMADADLPLTLQRQATFGKSFNATPEPVKKGKKITLKAKLARVNWNGAKALKYVGFNGKVKVQFKVAGATTYKTVKTVQATSKGQISTTVKATKSGSWRFVFAGYSTTSPATSVADAVKVK